MESIILAWLKSKSPEVILRYKVVGEELKYGSMEFLKEGKFFVCSVLFDKFRIYGLNSFKSENLLEGQVSEPNRVNNFDVFNILDRNTVTYSNREEWLKNRRSLMRKEELDKVLVSKYTKILELLNSVEVGVFKVAKVDILSQFNISLIYTFRGRPQLPLGFNVGSPSLVEERFYERDTMDFIKFIEGIGRIVGEVKWYRG